MNYYPVNYYPVIFRPVHTDRMWSICAHRAKCTGGLKNPVDLKFYYHHPKAPAIRKLTTLISKVLFAWCDMRISLGSLTIAVALNRDNTVLFHMLPVPTDGALHIASPHWSFYTYFHTENCCGRGIHKHTWSIITLKGTLPAVYAPQIKTIFIFDCCKTDMDHRWSKIIGQRHSSLLQISNCRGFQHRGKIMEFWKMAKLFFRPGKIMEFEKKGQSHRISKCTMEKSWNFVF